MEKPPPLPPKKNLGKIFPELLKFFRVALLWQRCVHTWCALPPDAWGPLSQWLIHHSWLTTDGLWDEAKVKLPFLGESNTFTIYCCCLCKNQPIKPTPSHFPNAQTHIWSITGHCKSQSRVIYQTSSSIEPAGIWDWIYPGFSSGFGHILPFILHSVLNSSHLPWRNINGHVSEHKAGSWSIPTPRTCYFNQYNFFWLNPSAIE